MIALLIALIVFGALVYIVRLLPIDNTFKTIAQVVLVVFAVIWLLRNFGHAAGF